MATDYSLQLERLARVFNDDTQPPKILPTKPDDPQSVLSLPPQNLKEFHKQTPPEQIVSQRLEQIANPSLTKEQAQPQPQPQPSEGLATKEQTSNIHKQELPQQHVVVEQEQEQLIKRGRGRPKGSKNKAKIEKVSPRAPQFPIGASSASENEKVSQAPTSEYLPVNLSIPQQSNVKGKTSLCYALIYARELTPVQVETLLASQLELNLTSAEVIALSLIDRTIKHDQKAEKIYWDLLKNEQKNAKITPVKAENTLLDEALAKAENAIFGEIVVDNPEQP